MIKSVGVVGMGEFGRLIVKYLPKDVEVLASSRRDIQVEGAKMVSFEEVAKADVVILATPFESIEPLLEKLKPLISQDTLLVDVTSIKVKVEEIFDRLLPDHPNVLLTHPLFGPQTIKKDLVGHTFVVTKQKGQAADEAMKWVKSMGLDVVEMSSDEHDKQMADVHALTYFIARGMNNIGVKDQVLKTPSFEATLRLIFLDNSHSQDLFETFEKHNPYAKQRRQDLIDALTQIHKSLN